MTSWALVAFRCEGGPLDGQVLTMPEAARRLEVGDRLELHGYVQGDSRGVGAFRAMHYAGVVASGDLGGSASGDQPRRLPGGSIEQAGDASA